MTTKEKLKLKVKKKVKSFDLSYFNDNEDFLNPEIINEDQVDYLKELNLDLNLHSDN